MNTNFAVKPTMPIPQRQAERGHSCPPARPASTKGGQECPRADQSGQRPRFRRCVFFATCWWGLIIGIPNLAAAPAPLFINEIQPNNSSWVPDDAGDFDPWIEIYNYSSATTVSLDDFCLTTNYANLARWRFPPGRQLGPGQFLLVWADGEPDETTAAELHAGFRLPPDRGSVALSRLVAGLPEVVDFVDYDFGLLGPDLSYGSFPDGPAGVRQLMLIPTPLGDNRETPLTVRINEWQSAIPGAGNGWFELFNPGNATVTLSGNYLTDTPNNPQKFLVPSGRTIAPKGFLRVWADANPNLNDSDPVDLHVNFLLGSGFIGLYMPNGTPADILTIPQLPPGTAQGRFPDGAQFIYTGTSTTPRAPNRAPPTILEPPRNQTVAMGGEAVFTVRAFGSLPMNYRWSRNGNVIVPNGGPELRLTDVQPFDAGEYSVEVINSAGSTSSPDVSLSVLELPEVTIKPTSVVVEPGAPLRLVASGGGSPPFNFQWRLNGQDIPGATDNAYVIQSVQTADAGVYEVVVANPAGATTSDPTQVRLAIQGPSSADAFKARVSLEGFSGLISGSNQGATREAGEPNHAGKSGGKSIWYTWRAPGTGVATFNTQGSGLDTLLAVYNGEKIETLTEVASDDEDGGFHTSLVRFNATRSVDYQIAVDGFAGAEGDILLNWSLDEKAAALPVIIAPPVSQTLREGSRVILSVTTSPAQVQYQWLHNGSVIRGADGRTLTIDKLTPFEVGFYSVLVSTGEATVESPPAIVEIGPVPDVQSQDKFADLFLNDPPPPQKNAPRLSGAGLFDAGGAGFISVSMGTIVSHTFDNSADSVTDVGEPNPCGNITHSTRWLDFQTDENGICLVRATGMLTNETPFPTVVAVFAITNLIELLPVACATNSPEATAHFARFPALAGTRYLALADGIGESNGVITIEWLLGSAPDLSHPTNDFLVDEGDNLLLGIEAAGWIPLPSFHWRLEGATLPLEHADTLNLLDVHAADAGTYSIVVSNAINTVTDTVAHVSVRIPLLVQLETTNSPSGFGELFGAASQAYQVLCTTNFQCWTPLMLISNVPFTLNESVPLGPEPSAQYLSRRPVAGRPVG